MWSCGHTKEDDDQTVVIEALVRGEAADVRDQPSDGVVRDMQGVPFVDIAKGGGGISTTMGGDWPTLPRADAPVREGDIRLAGGDWARMYVPSVVEERPLVSGGRRGSDGAREPLPSVPTIEAGAAGNGVEQWRSLVSQYPWPVDEVLRVMQCESSGNPLAENAGSLGLMQIHFVSHHRRVNSAADLFDPATNIKVAFDIWRDNAGWGPWSCKP